MEDESISASVQNQFGKVAANYTTSQVHAGGADLTELVQQAELTGDERVLDAGTGAGHAAMAVAPHASEVVAYDFTQEMLTQVQHNARERSFNNVRTELGDVAALPFDDQSFDRIISRYSAHHWPHPLAALTEFQRVLKPGGKLLIGDVVAPAAPISDTFLQTLELLRDPSHVRDYSSEQWLRFFKQAGFKAEVVFTWPVNLVFDRWVERMATPQQNIDMLKTLFDGAPGEVRSEFQIQDNYDFTIPGAIIKGIVEAQP